MHLKTMLLFKHDSIHLHPSPVVYYHTHARQHHTTVRALRTATLLLGQALNPAAQYSRKMQHSNSFLSAA
jgi:hypothetical protein